MLLANRYFDESLGDYAWSCARDHLEDGIFPHNSDEHP